jgi:hypothetical protein
MLLRQRYPVIRPTTNIIQFLIRGIVILIDMTLSIAIATIIATIMVFIVVKITTPNAHRLG